jgi:hypothetical protein
MHLHHGGGSVRGASALSGSPEKDVPQWWNGRRAGFKILFRKECPFESGLGHHFNFGHWLVVVFPNGKLTAWVAIDP